jgi:hypothetical protein
MRQRPREILVLYLVFLVPSDKTDLLGVIGLGAPRTMAN